MNLHDRLQKRFNQLRGQMETVPGEQNDEVYGVAWNHFVTSTRNLIQTIFGKESVHFRAFERIVEKSIGTSLINSIKGVFLAAANDFDCGLVDIDSAIAGEIFADFTRLATRALQEGHKDVAAVLASAALEDAMKKLATKNAITLADDAPLSQIIAALKSARVIGGNQAAMLTGMQRIRNAAMHANWQEINDSEVRTLIVFVEGLIGLHFSPTD
jgi:hypothetical protein